MENQTEKTRENAMDIGIIRFIGGVLLNPKL